MFLENSVHVNSCAKMPQKFDRKKTVELISSSAHQFQERLLNRLLQKIQVLKVNYLQ